MSLARKASAPVAASRAAAETAAAAPVRPASALQATIGNRAVQRLLRLQPKLQVSTRGDASEQSADRTADAVMQSPAAAPPPGRRRGSPGASRSFDDIFPTSGQPLDAPTRTFMESRFDRDFGRVRVHTDAESSESARQIHARAYTVGEHIAFGAGEYAPAADAGRRLLAHELAHVVQQGEAPGAGVIQRAETDDRSCAGLTDIEPDVDKKVNDEIAAARKAAGTPIALGPFLIDVNKRLGDGVVSPIEKFIEALPATKHTPVSSSLAGTKYEGVDAVNRFYKLQTLGLAHVVGSAAKVHSICIGADKLGHFFSEGFTYVVIRSRGGSVADTESAGRSLEIGIQGLGIGEIQGSTGVFSNADRAANRKGMQFYIDLAADPAMKFAISNYIDTDWNEQTNPSFYGSAEANVVWSNLLTGGWTGSFTTGGGAGPAIAVGVGLTATTGGKLTGSYSYTTSGGTKRTGKILNGTITQRTKALTGTFPGDAALSATAVVGIDIAFDWEEGKNSGKGVWQSTDEQTLTGTWGVGASRTDGGAWNIRKA